jgi:hypothetical protein
MRSMIQNQSFNIALLDGTPRHKIYYSLMCERKEWVYVIIQNENF